MVGKVVGKVVGGVVGEVEDGVVGGVVGKVVGGVVGEVEDGVVGKVVGGVVDLATAQAASVHLRSYTCAHHTHLHPHTRAHTLASTHLHPHTRAHTLASTHLHPHTRAHIASTHVKSGTCCKENCCLVSDFGKFCLKNGLFAVWW